MISNFWIYRKNQELAQYDDLYSVYVQPTDDLNRYCTKENGTRFLVVAKTEFKEEDGKQGFNTVAVAEYSTFNEAEALVAQIAKALEDVTPDKVKVFFIPEYEASMEGAGGESTWYQILGLNKDTDGLSDLKEGP